MADFTVLNEVLWRIPRHGGAPPVAVAELPRGALVEYRFRRHGLIDDSRQAATNKAIPRVLKVSRGKRKVCVTSCFFFANLTLR